MPKPVLLIAIDDFGIGGAEMLVIGELPDLNKHYNVVLVNLTAKSDFKKEEIICFKRYILDFSGKLSFPQCIVRLKKIIKIHQPVLVHAHLLYSSIIARIACPRDIPFVQTLHAIMSKNVFDKSILYKWVEKLTLKRKHYVIAVSATVLADYEVAIKRVSKSYVLKNFISDSFIDKNIEPKNINVSDQLKLVAVGNVKQVKNYAYIVDAFNYLKEYNITLDIYGYYQDDIVNHLQQVINRNQLPIRFKGKKENISEILPMYDAYVMCSKNEGFGIAAIEAMALGLPLLLSDLPVLREVTFNNALFFNVDDVMSFVKLVKEIIDNKYDLNKLSARGIHIARESYSKQVHLKNLFRIYNEILS